MSRNRAILESIGLTLATVLLLTGCWLVLVLPPLDGDIRLTPAQERIDAWDDALGYIGITLTLVGLFATLALRLRGARYLFVLGVVTTVVFAEANVYRYRDLGWVMERSNLIALAVTIVWVVSLCWWLWSLDRRMRHLHAKRPPGRQT